MSTGIERPIELVPAKVRELLGLRRTILELPMLPPPVLSSEQREALRGGLAELGYMAEHSDDLDLVAHGFDEGLLPSLRCPWGRGGDCLWVREPWTQVGRSYRHCSRDVLPQADDLLWYPAVRMPREAARLALKIESVGIGRGVCGDPVWVIGAEVLRA